MPPPPPPPPQEVWVAETLDASPVRPHQRPRPVPETVPPPSQLPSTPPRPGRQLEPVSPVLPGRTPASRRARRAAHRAGAVHSPVPPPLPPPQKQPATPPRAQTTATTVVSPTPSLTSPLLLPQRLPERPRRPAVTAVTLAESPKTRIERSTVKSARGTSRLSLSKPSQAKEQSASSLAHDVSKEGSPRKPPPAKKKKYMFIGPYDPVPPRKPRRAAAPQKSPEREANPSEQPSTNAQQWPACETASRSGVAPVTTAQSIFELPGSSIVRQQHSAFTKGQPSNDGLSTGNRRKANEESASSSAHGASKEESPRKPPPAKKKKYMFIGPYDPVPPRKPRRAAAPQKSPEREANPQEPPSTNAQQWPACETASHSGVGPVTTAQSIFELPGSSIIRQQHSTSTKGQPSNGGLATGNRTPSKRKTTPKKSEELRDGSTQVGVEEPSQGAESMVGLEVLLEEIDHDGAQIQPQAQQRGQYNDQGKHHNPVKGQSGGQRDPPSREAPHALVDTGIEPDETTDVSDGGQPEHESQDETQMDR